MLSSKDSVVTSKFPENERISVVYSEKSTRWGFGVGVIVGVAVGTGVGVASVSEGLVTSVDSSVFSVITVSDSDSVSSSDSEIKTLPRSDIPSLSLSVSILQAARTVVTMTAEITSAVILFPSIFFI